MLSDKDFDRLITDPRLGTVKRFFHPVRSKEQRAYSQHIEKTSSELYEYYDTDFCWGYETSYEDAQPYFTIKCTKDTPVKRKKSKRCNSCSNCMIKDCGKCIQCLDKPRFGGRGIRKQCCALRRRCQIPDN